MVPKKKFRCQTVGLIRCVGGGVVLYWSVEKKTYGTKRDNTKIGQGSCRAYNLLNGLIESYVDCIKGPSSIAKKRRDVHIKTNY
jgi:hypothetical protein